MKISTIILVIVIIFYSPVIHAHIKNDTCKCNEAIIVRTNDNIKLLTHDDISIFLSTFDNNCTSAEFEEYSNEMLFRVVENYPDEVIELLNKKNKINKKQIYTELSSPIEDMDYKQIMVRLCPVIGNNRIKTKLMGILQLDEKLLESDERKYQTH